jgi:hypothetical protein
MRCAGIFDYGSHDCRMFHTNLKELRPQEIRKTDHTDDLSRRKNPLTAVASYED